MSIDTTEGRQVGGRGNAPSRGLFGCYDQSGCRIWLWGLSFTSVQILAEVSRTSKRDIGGRSCSEIVKGLVRCSWRK